MHFFKDPIAAGFAKAKAEDEARKKQEELLNRWDLGSGLGGFSSGFSQYTSTQANQQSGFDYNSMMETWRRIMEQAARDSYNEQYEQARQNHYQNQARPQPAVTEDCFKVLGLVQPCTEKDIMTAFRKLARDAHPDTGGSTEKFQKLNAAKMEALRRIK